MVSRGNEGSAREPPPKARSKRNLRNFLSASSESSGVRKRQVTQPADDLRGEPGGRETSASGACSSSDQPQREMIQSVGQTNAVSSEAEDLANIITRKRRRTDGNPVQPKKSLSTSSQQRQVTQQRNTRHLCVAADSSEEITSGLKPCAPDYSLVCPKTDSMAHRRSVSPGLQEALEAVKRYESRNGAPIPAGGLSSAKPTTPERRALRAVTDPEICPICFQERAEFDTLATPDSCTHVFCYPCLEAAAKTKRDCPVCRAAFGKLNKFSKIEHTSSSVRRQPSKRSGIKVACEIPGFQLAGVDSLPPLETDDSDYYDSDDLDSLQSWAGYDCSICLQAVDESYQTCAACGLNFHLGCLTSGGRGRWICPEPCGHENDEQISHFDFFPYPNFSDLSEGELDRLAFVNPDAFINGFFVSDEDEDEDEMVELRPSFIRALGRRARPGARRPDGSGGPVLPGNSSTRVRRDTSRVESGNTASVRRNSNTDSRVRAARSNENLRMPEARLNTTGDLDSTWGELIMEAAATRERNRRRPGNGVGATILRSRANRVWDSGAGNASSGNVSRGRGGGPNVIRQDIAESAVPRYAPFQRDDASDYVGFRGGGSREDGTSLLLTRAVGRESRTRGGRGRRGRRARGSRGSGV